MFLHYLGKKWTKYCIYATLVVLLNQNNTKNTFCPYHVFIILADSLFNCLFFNCIKKSSKCWPMNMGSDRRHFLHSLIAASIMFCSRPIQTSPVASWIYQYSQMLNLYNRCAAAQQSNLVVDWLLVAAYQERWNLLKLLLILMHILSVLFFPGRAEAYIGWAGKLNGHLMSSCVRKMCIKNY